MFHLLEKLRTKSRAQRTFIAFSIALFFTGIIFVMWLVAEQKPEDVETVKVITENTPTDTLVKNITDIWGSVTGAAKEAQEVVKSIDLSSTVEYSATSSSTPTQ